MASERLYADGLELDGLAHWIGLESNRWSVPGVKGENVPVPARHGSLYVSNKTFTEGTFSLQFVVHGTDNFGNQSLNELRKLSENIDRLLRVVTRRSGLIHFEYVREDGNTIECYAECVAAFEIQRTSSQLPFAKFVAEFRIPEAFWQDSSLRTARSPTALQDGQAIRLDELSGGTAPMNDGIYLFHGKADEPEIRVIGTSAVVKLVGVTLSATQTWRLDAKRWSSTVGTKGTVTFDTPGTTVIGKTVHQGSASFVDIPPFVPSQLVIEAGGRNFGTTSQIEARGRRKYMIGG